MSPAGYWVSESWLFESKGSGILRFEGWRRRSELRNELPAMTQLSYTSFYIIMADQRMGLLPNSRLWDSIFNLVKKIGEVYYLFINLLEIYNKVSIINVWDSARARRHFFLYYPVISHSSTSNDWPRFSDFLLTLALPFSIQLSTKDQPDNIRTDY